MIPTTTKVGNRDKLPARAQAASCDVFGLLGHELRNPLAAAIAGLGVVDEMLDPDDPRAPFVDAALAELRRTVVILDGCLQLSSVGDAVVRSEVDLTDLVARVAQRYPAVVVHAAGEPVVVAGSAVLLERVLENLIGNALAAGAGTVTLFVDESSDNRVAVHVSDDGPGVPPAIAADIFAPFVSGRGSTGLGLAIVKRILDVHGGDIGLLPSGQGALFCITLPR